MLSLLLLANLALQTGPATDRADAREITSSWARFDDSDSKRALVGAEARLAIEAGLEWLARAQRPDGSWSTDADTDTAPSLAATALALLAFLGDGHSTGLGSRSSTVARGFAWLRAQPFPASRSRELALATLACAEARTFDGEEALPQAAAWLEALARARTSAGVWAREPGLAGDVLASAWGCEAFCAAQAWSAQIGSDELDSLRHWFDARVEKSGLIPVEDEGAFAERGSAVGLLARVCLQESLEQAPYMERQARRLTRRSALPDWEQADLEYWYAATSALQRLGGEGYLEWEPALRRMLLAQRDGTDGHWPALGTAAERSAARSTALALLMLEAPYRFLRRESGPVAPTSPTSPTSPSAAGPRIGGVVGIGAPGPEFRARFQGEKERLAGGGSGTERALADALDWLARVQSEDGAWRLADSPYPVGCTSLATLALLGGGHSMRVGTHRTVVSKALRWLLEQQDPKTGAIAGSQHQAQAYEHALATTALAEAYDLSRSPLLLPKLTAAVEHLLAARNPKGAWRYEFPPNGESDTAVTGVTLLALVAARKCSLPIADEAYAAAIQGGLSWFDQVSDPETGLVGYSAMHAPSSRLHKVNDQYPRADGEAMTALALQSRLFAGQRPSEVSHFALQVERLMRHLPVEPEAGDLSLDMFYWHFATNALFQLGGREWKAWNSAMKRAVLPRQRKDGELAGSWDPSGVWGCEGGRVYSTAMMALTLEVYCRYPRLESAR